MTSSDNVSLRREVEQLREQLNVSRREGEQTREQLMVSRRGGGASEGRARTCSSPERDADQTASYKY